MDDLDRMMNDIGNMSGVDNSDGFLGGHAANLKYKGINLRMIIASIIAAAAAWVIDLLIYNIFKNVLPRPLLIGIVFTILGLILGTVLTIFGRDSGNKVDAKVQIIGTIIGSLLLLGLGGLFQFIYQLTLKKAIIEPTSYVFVIDDSGSMSDSDPAGKRYSSIEMILQDKAESFPYMVYGFSDNSYIIRDMAPKSEGMEPITGQNLGGTSISGTLKNVINDYENGIWQGGAAPKVILLTDGYATDIFLGIELKDTLKRYNKRGISISCVGLGDVDRDLMNQIASSTNGVFVDVDDASQLTEAMKSAAAGYNEVERDLVSERSSGNGIVYGLLRVLFLTLLGALIGLVKYFSYGDRDSFKTLFGLTVVSSLIGSVLMEGGTDLGLPAVPLWLLLWLLYSVAVADKSIYIQSDAVKENNYLDF